MGAAFAMLHSIEMALVVLDPVDHWKLLLGVYFAVYVPASVALYVPL
mgnify:CR=1 FL=1